MMVCSSPLTKQQDDEKREYKNIETLLKEMEIGTPIDEESNTDLDLHELLRLKPVIVEKLRLHGHLETYRKWCQLISEDKFPVESICFLLFLDVIE